MSDIEKAVRKSFPKGVDSITKQELVTGIKKHFHCSAKGGATGINGVTADELGADAVYQLNGVRTDQMKQGVNIVVKNGKAIKVLKK